MSPAPAARVTVVVCSLDGEASLGRTLNALAAQTVADVVDVLVVDDGSSDGTSLVASRHGARVIVHDDNRGLAAARNTGWRSAGTPLVAFTDDDCRPSPDWVERMLDGFDRHPEAVAVGGAVRGSDDNTFMLRYLQRSNPLAPLESALLESDNLAHRLSLYVQRSASPETPTGERTVSSIVGASMLFEVAALERHDGFDPRFRFGGEEEDLCRRMVLAGDELVFLPDAVVEHDFEKGLGDTLRRSRAYGRGNARMFLKHRGLVPTVYPLPVVVGALLAIAVGRRSPPAAVLAGALPCMLFSRWIGEAVRLKEPERLAYPYVQLAQETWGDVGLLEELHRGRGAFRAQVAR